MLSLSYPFSIFDNIIFHVFYLTPFTLSKPDKLQTEVEHKTTFSLNHCELNIFETHRSAANVMLQFGGFTITSMLRGKKVIHNTNQSSFDYVPGQSLMVPSNEYMVIDFPEANYHQPSQCTALVLDNHYMQKQLDYINETYPRYKEDRALWQLNPHELFIKNDEKIATLGSRLIKIFAGTDPLKDILVDIRLKELLLSILRLQNVQAVNETSQTSGHVSERFYAVVEYIKNNATSTLSISQLSKMACMSKSAFYRAFTHEFGTSPNQMILKERIKMAKNLLLADAVSIKDVCFATGFSDPNYFTRLFKKNEGITPGEYVAKCKKDS